MIRELTLNEIQTTYQQHLINDFPQDEVKPLAIIEKLYQEKQYRCFGLFNSQNQLLAYAYLATFQQSNLKSYLLDYYAVVSTYRNQGHGSQLLQALLKQLGDYCLLVEIEDLQKASTAKEKQIRQRRLNFYQQNGLKLTKVSAYLYGVDYQIMYYAQQNYNDAFILQELTKVYAQLFAHVVPKPYQVTIDQ